MTNTLRDLLRHDADSVEIPILDANDVIVRGEQRLDRRRTCAVLAAVAAVAVIAAGGIVAGSAQHRSDGPVNQPDDNKPAEPVTREIVYKDGMSGSVVHYGDRRVEAGPDFLSMDVTDAGFVYLLRPVHDEPQTVWFSDGQTTQQIGTLCDVLWGPDFSTQQSNAVTTDNAGSLAAWIDCTDTSTPALVVLDTSSGREVVRIPQDRLTPNGSDCGGGPLVLIGEHLYFEGSTTRQGRRADTCQGLMLDLETRQVTKTTRPYLRYDGFDSAAYADDIRSRPRGLVVGDTWQTGGQGSGIGQEFAVVGSRLRAGLGNHLTAAFDTGTGDAIHLQLPPGYNGPTNFVLFEWLNDDTVALIAYGGNAGWPGGDRYGDIMTCRLSTGSCHLAVPGPGPDVPDTEARVVPHLPIPE